MSQLVVTHNALLPSSLHQFLPPLPSDPKIIFYTSATLPEATFTKCFNLIRTNMMAMYKRSSLGWSAANKKKEMRHLDMRFLILHSLPQASGEDKGEWEEEGEEEEDRFLGFASFMVTVEEGEDVIYCYELQLAEGARGVGHGERLMRVLEGFGKNGGLQKAELTVFTENTGAIRFYKRIGYELDEISPVPRKLRSGEVRQPSYYIFSKKI